MSIWVVYLIRFSTEREVELLKIAESSPATPVDSIPYASNPMMSEDLRTRMHRQSLHDKKKEYEEAERDYRAEMESKMEAVVKAMREENEKMLLQKEREYEEKMREKDRILAKERANNQKEALAATIEIHEEILSPPPLAEDTNDSPSQRKRPLRNSLQRSSIGDLISGISDIALQQNQDSSGARRMSASFSDFSV